MSSSSSNKRGVWHKAKPATIIIDATYGGDEEEADTTTIGDVTVCTKAPQAPAALSEPVEVKVAIKQEEVKDEEQSPAPVGFNKPKFSAESLIHKYETLKKKLQALTFTFKQAPTSAPSWCVLGDIATPELLDLLDTTQPASALRHLKASCNLKPLTVKISPITGWAAGKTTTPVPAWCVLGDVATPELLAVITATKPTSPLRACALRLKAHCARKQPKSTPTAAYSGPKVTGRIPTWCVISDLADTDLMALIASTKKTRGATAAEVVSALRCCVLAALRVKARWSDVRS